METAQGASSSENNIGLNSSSTKVVMEVDGALVHFVKGGSTQKQIEEETGVKLTFLCSKDGTSVVLEGNSAESITKASKKIHNVLEQAVQGPKLDYSHFISLPLAIHPNLVRELKQFKNENSDFGINKPILFTDPKTFHLTVLMLKLWNKDRIDKALDVLQSLSSRVNEALGNRPIFIQLKGLACMNGSPDKARVVYVPVLEVGGEERLARACKIIIDAFVKSKLVIERDANKELKLHATIMKVRHRKSNIHNQWNNDTFDARGRFEKYGKKEWGNYHIREVHLSKRFVYGESGYYHCISSIPLPV